MSRFCHGHRPVVSTSSEKLRKVRMRTIDASIATLVRLGEVATVRTMSPATSSSRPSRMAWLSRWRKTPVDITFVPGEPDGAGHERDRCPGHDDHYPGGIDGHPDLVDHVVEIHL